MKSHTQVTASLRAAKADIYKLNVKARTTLAKGADCGNDLNVNEGNIFLNSEGVLTFGDGEPGTIIPEPVTTADYIPDEFFKSHFDLQRDGKIFGTRIYKSKSKVSNEQGANYDGISGSDQSMGEPLMDSVGMRCLPYIEGVQDAVDDFTDKVPMFRKWRCNAFLDDNGDIRVKYIQGQKGYKRTFKEGETAMDDCILKMSFYWKKNEGDTYYDYFVSDTNHGEGWQPFGYCIRHDGSVAPYFALPAYFSSMHKDADGFQRMYSLTNSVVQGGISHESQLPFYSQTLTDELLDNNTYSYAVGPNNGTTSDATYRGRGRHYGTRVDINAYLMLMAIIKYRTRNLGSDGNANASLNYNVTWQVPNRNADGSEASTNSNQTLMPFKGKDANFDGQHRCALESILSNYAIWWTDYKNGVAEKRNTGKTLYHQFDPSILPDDYDGSWFPVAPKLDFAFGNSATETDADGLPIKVLSTITERCLFREGNPVCLLQQYLNNGVIQTPTFSSTDKRGIIDKKAIIEKIETFPVTLPETQVPYDAFEVTKYDGTKMTIPAGFAIIPAGTYNFYKIYLEDYKQIPAFETKLYTAGSCLDPNNTAYSTEQRGRTILQDNMCPAGMTDRIVGLYDGSALRTTGNTKIHAYWRRSNVVNGVKEDSSTYGYENYLNSYSPYRLEGIEYQNGFWMIPSNAFLRGIHTLDENGNTVEKKFEIWVAKKRTAKHRLLNASGSWRALVENDEDRSEDFAKNYKILNLDPTSLSYFDVNGNAVSRDWGWVADVEFEQMQDGTILMYPAMTCQGIRGIASTSNGSTNVGDYVWGQPATSATVGTTKYSYRELLLCGGYGHGSGCGFACLHANFGLTYGYWDCSRPRLVKSQIPKFLTIATAAEREGSLSALKFLFFRPKRT